MFVLIYDRGGNQVLYQQIVKERSKIEEEIENIQCKLEKLPEGNLILAKNGPCYYKWYYTDGSHKKYIPKKEHYTVEKLAYKKYLSVRLKGIEKEKRAIDFYLKHHDENTYLKEQELLENPEFQKLISKIYQPKEQKLIDWMNSPYKTNKAHPEQLIHRTRSGVCVRSKSELLITMVLSKYHIPFRYECALQLGEVFIYPDFTICHPITGEIFYWEHFGLMDDVSYSQKAFSKLQLYTSNGIIPSVNLITTYETKINPLSEKMVEEIIKYYFLQEV